MSKADPRHNRGMLLLYLPRSASWIEEMEKRSRRRTRDLVTQAASQGLSQNEIGCARISMMARSTNAPCKGRIQMRKTNPLHFQIRLATHGRSIQMGSETEAARPERHVCSTPTADIIGPSAQVRNVPNKRHRRMQGVQRKKPPEGGLSIQT